VDLSTTDTGTLGPLFVRGTEATIDPIVLIYNVVTPAVTLPTIPAAWTTAITNGVWDEPTANHTIAGSTCVALTSAGGGTGIQEAWKFDTTTTAADPGSGKFRYNTATPSTVTQIYLDRITSGGMDFSNYLRTFAAGDTVTVQDNGNATNWAKYTLSAPPTDNGGWWTLGVTFVGSGGVLPSNNTLCAFLFRPASATGDPWSTVIPGAYGAGTAGHRLGNIPDIAAGGAGGLFIAGTNAATVITGTLTTHLVGTVDTVTTLTNLPSIPANWITAAGITASALNGKGDWPPVATALSTVNWTTARAGYLDNLNVGGAVASHADIVGVNTAMGSPMQAGALVKLDLTAAVPTTGNTANTVGDCLNAARAQGFGNWVISGTTLTLYAPDGTTVVKAFNLNDAVNPSQRT
jgi:hypothetical protein